MVSSHEGRRLREAPESEAVRTTSPEREPLRAMSSLFSCINKGVFSNNLTRGVVDGNTSDMFGNKARSETMNDDLLETWNDSGTIRED